MKKGKMTMTITIGIACFALVTVMMMQFKVVNETDITEIENMQEAELKTELANWKTRYEEIDAQYEETTQRIEEYKSDEVSNNEASQLVREELEQTNTLLGLTDVHGEGIVITLKSGEGNSQLSGLLKTGRICLKKQNLRKKSRNSSKNIEKTACNPKDYMIH